MKNKGRRWIMRRAVIALNVCLLTLLAVAVANSGSRTDDPLGVSIAPHTLILNSYQGGTVTVHTDIPYGSVVANSLELSGIPVDWTKADDRGCLVAMFEETEVKEVVSSPAFTLTLRGVTVDGESFSGSDTVQVVSHNK